MLDTAVNNGAPIPHPTSPRHIPPHPGPRHATSHPPPSAGMVAVMDNEDQTGPFNIGNPGEFTMTELAELVREVVNPKAEVGGGLNRGMGRGV